MRGAAASTQILTVALLGVSLGLFATGAAGCGGDDDDDDGGAATTTKSPTSSSSDKQQVSKTVDSFNTAIADGDGQTACGLATAKAQRSFTKSQDEPDCATSVEEFSKLLAEGDKDTLRTSKVTDVRFATRGGRRTARADFGGTVPRELVKSGDQWLLDNILNF